MIVLRTKPTARSRFSGTACSLELAVRTAANRNSEIVARTMERTRCVKCGDVKYDGEEEASRRRD
jgi:hypothetical protein